jgi:hypothetical protein
MAIDEVNKLLVFSGYLTAFALGCTSNTLNDPIDDNLDPWNTAGSNFATAGSMLNTAPTNGASASGAIGAAGLSNNAGVATPGGTGSNTAKGGTGGNTARGGSGGSSPKGGTGGGTSGKGGTGGTSGKGGTGGAAGAAGKFSFFVTSFKALQRLSGADKGFGGDFRYGETGNGAGLRGADKICSTIAETSMPGAGSKIWRAFLSATNYDQDGKAGQVNAIDRVGNGPWYDRRGRVFSLTKADLLNTRPASADTLIKNDFPNEDGTPNHDPDGTGEVDNHDTLTGTNTEGKLYSATATCKDWTTADGSTANGRPRVGHSWPRGTGGGPGGGPGGGEMGHWMSSLDEAGCAPGYYMPTAGQPDGPPDYNQNFVGSGGGYGGFYCFALSP